MKILSILSVTSIVGFGGTPAAIGDREIQIIRAMVGSGLPISPSRPVYVGQRVRICDGALLGLEGVLTREKSGCRVIVNVDLLQRAVAVDVHREQVAPIEAARVVNAAVAPFAGRTTATRISGI